MYSDYHDEESILDDKNNDNDSIKSIVSLQYVDEQNIIKQETKTSFLVACVKDDIYNRMLPYAQKIFYTISIPQKDDIIQRNHSTKEIKCSIIEEKEIMKLSTIAIQLVEFYELKGTQKKEVVLSIVETYVDKFILNLDLVKSLKKYIKETIPTFIDIVVDSSKGAYNINKMIKKGEDGCCCVIM
jgi:hypothetical protein